jgi:hypothetical protein
MCRVLHPEKELICNNSKDSDLAVVSVKECAWFAQNEGASSFCVEGFRCFIQYDELKPLLDVAQPSDKCDKKTGKGWCLS